MPAARLLAALSLLLLIPVLAGAAPLGRSFTYQGELRQSGTPLDGTVHLRFSLWDAAGTGDPPTGGTQIGSSQIVPNVSVEDGRRKPGTEEGARAAVTWNNPGSRS